MPSLRGKRRRQAGGLERVDILSRQVEAPKAVRLESAYFIKTDARLRLNLPDLVA